MKFCTPLPEIRWYGRIYRFINSSINSLIPYQFINSYQSIHQFINSLIYQSSINLSIHFQFINKFINKFINSSIHQFINLSIYQFINLSIYQFINLSIHQFINSSIYQFMNLLIYQFINLPSTFTFTSNPPTTLLLCFQLFHILTCGLDYLVTTLFLSHYSSSFVLYPTFFLQLTPSLCTQIVLLSLFPYSYWQTLYATYLWVYPPNPWSRSRCFGGARYPIPTLPFFTLLYRPSPR